MSSIPPAGHASLIQAHGAARRAAETSEKEAAAESKRTRNDKFADRLQEVIENDNLDSQVYADAEGAGSQGKRHADERDESSEADDENTSDAESDGHLDIEA